MRVRYGYSGESNRVEGQMSLQTKKGLIKLFETNWPERERERGRKQTQYWLEARFESMTFIANILTCKLKIVNN